MLFLYVIRFAKIGTHHWFVVLSLFVSLCLSFDVLSEIIWHAADCVVILVVLVVCGV